MIRTSLTCVTVTGLIAMSGGCAQQQTQRIALLEEVNRNLTERLNMMGGDLDMVTRDRDALGTQLDQSALDLAAMQANLDALQGDLDARPIAQDTAPGWTAVPGGAVIAIESGVLFAPGKSVIRTWTFAVRDGSRGIGHSNSSSTTIMAVGSGSSPSWNRVVVITYSGSYGLTARFPM